MILSQWLRQLAQRCYVHNRTQRRPARRHLARVRRSVRPRLEVLEDRLTPSGEVLAIGPTQPQNYTTKLPSGAIIVQLQDGHGNAINATTNLTVTLSSNSSGGKFLDLSGNALSSPNVTIAGGSSYALFEYEDNNDGVAFVTAKTQLSGADVSGKMIFAVHNTLAFITPSQVTDANQPSGTITVQLQDGQGNPVTATTDTKIKLSSISSQTAKFLDTSGNPLANNQITITAGTNQASFKYEDTPAQTFPSLIFADTLDGLTHVAQSEYVGLPIAIITPSMSVPVGVKTGPITVQMLSAPSNVMDVTIGLTSTSSGGQFFDTKGNVLPNFNGQYGVVLHPGETTASFLYSDSQQGCPVITATNTFNSAQSANMVEDIGVPVHANAVIVSPWQSIGMSQASHLMTLQLQNTIPVTTPIDALNNLAVTLKSTSNTGQFLDASGNPLPNSSITIPAGSSTVTFEYKDSQAGLPQLSAFNFAANVFGIGQVENVGGVAMRFTTDPQTFAAGTPSQPITVQLKDSNGNPVNASGDTDIFLSSSIPAGGTFLDTSGQPLSSPFITIAAGSSSASFEYESKWGGKQTLTASATSTVGFGFNSPQISATQQETINGVSSLTFETSSQTVSAGDTSGTVTVQLLDSNGNLAQAPKGGANIHLSSTSAKFFDLIGNLLPNSSFTIPEGGSQGSFTFQITKAGSVPITADVEGAFQATQTETIKAGTAVGPAFDTPPQTLLPNIPSGSIVVELVDKYGNTALAPSGGVTVNVASSFLGSTFLTAGGVALGGPSHDFTIPEGFSSVVFEFENANADVTQTLTASWGSSVSQDEKIANLEGPTIHVTNTSDSGSDSLRDAITRANTLPGGSTIVFDSGAVGTIDLMSALPAITANMNIIGPGANKLTVERSASATTDFGIFVTGIHPTAQNPFPTEPTIALSGLTVANATGTGIINWGNLRLDQVVVSGNDAPDADTTSTSDFPFGPPGGIGNMGILAVLNSTIANNSTTGNAVAAGIDSETGYVTVLNSTITGNVDNNSNSAGGVGIYGGKAYIANSTISGNTATQQAQSDPNHGSGGGIDGDEGHVTLYNTIVAGNTSSPNNPTDVSGQFISLGHNLIGEANNQSSGFISSDQVGTAGSAIDAKLGALGDNGGPTPTMALLIGSPAIGAGSSVNSPATDQRGEARPTSGAIDVGAVEVTGNTAKPTVTQNPVDQSVVAGADVTFTASATGSPSPTVQWQVSADGVNFTDITGATSTSFTLQNVITAQADSFYRAVFTNSVGTATTSAAKLTVTAAAVKPSITGNPTNQSVTESLSATFTASADGSPTPTVQWQVSTDGGNTFNDISSATSTTLTVNNVTLAMSGNKYHAVFSNSAGTATSNAATLTVTAAVKPAITINPSNQSVTAGQSANFTATASGAPTPTVQWQVSTDNGINFTNIPGATSTTLTLSSVTTAMNGNLYHAVFSNVAGTVTSDIGKLTVAPAPPAPPPAPGGLAPAPPTPPPHLNPPPLLAFFNSFFGGGTQTVNADGSVTLTDSIFGFPLIVSDFDSHGNLVSVSFFGIDVTFIFVLFV